MLKKHEDAFGQGMYAYLKTGEAEEIVEREDGYIDVSMGPKNYLARYKDWPPHLKKAMKYAKGKVVDIGCGAGRHSLYLQDKGLDVLGIDNSPMALKVCKERGLKKTKPMTVTQMSKRMGTFDTILMLGNNWGLVGNPKRARWLLRRFYHMTSPEARIIAESMNVYDTDNPDHLWYHEYNRKRGREAGQIRLRARYKKYCTPWFDYLIVSKEEMEMILKGTGWQVKKYLDHGPAYIAIIEKER
jgi:2-polyprenyl-3-methyl-5-hydroxy-6-metoxy-1,4-benzoquinol methylase